MEPRSRRQARIERQLRETRKMDALGRFAGAIAHDFNNLLMVIAGFTDQVRGRLPPSDRSRADLDEVVAASERASVLVRQLLVFGRRTAAPDDSLCEMASALRDLEGLLGALVGTRVDLRVEADGSSCWVAVERSEIERVVLNLAGNARDAMPEGGTLLVRCGVREIDDTLTLERFALEPGTYVQLTVSDTGYGMDRTTRRRAFEPFFTTKGDGTGLGLATVYGIVRRHRGAVQIYSEPGEGTTFRIYLPCATGAPENTAESLRSKTPRIEGWISGRPTVVVAEDERALRRLARLTLERAGCRVVEAASGPEALEAIRSGQRLDLLITDLVMPGIGGRRLAELLREDRPDVPVLFISGNPAAAGNGGAQVLEKPFTPSELVAEVRPLLDSEARRRSVQ